MTDKKRLLDVKKNLKAKQPNFRRHDSHKKKKLSSNWRRPRGWQNKVRLNKKGYTSNLKSGYQTPKEVRGMDKNGLLPTRVVKIDDLKNLDPKEHSLIISGRLGGKKKIALVEKAAEKGFTINNSSKEAVAELRKKWQQKHEERKAEKKEREKKHKELEKEAEKKESLEEKAEKEADEAEKKEPKKETAPKKETPKQESKPAEKKAAPKKIDKPKQEAKPSKKEDKEN